MTRDQTMRPGPAPGTWGQPGLNWLVSYFTKQYIVVQKTLQFDKYVIVI